MPEDPALERAVGWFRAQPQMAERFGAAIRQSFDEVFDGQRTGRYSLAQLSKVEKTYIGTKVEIVIQAEFGLERGERMDYLVAGEEIDAKWSIRSGEWMIPTEAVGELCLCMTADDADSTFSVGIVRADEGNLRQGDNQDKKRQFKAGWKAAMVWLVDSGRLDENLLLHLSEEERSSILGRGLSGQQRVNQLFRVVLGRVVRREVVLTVAQQEDSPKRVRDARGALQPEGIIVLGHQGSHPGIAEGLGLEVPPKGSWIAAKVTKVTKADPANVKAVVIAGGRWRLAAPGDPISPGPTDYT